MFSDDWLFDLVVFRSQDQALLLDKLGKCVDITAPCDVVVLEGLVQSVPFDSTMALGEVGTAVAQRLPT